MWTLFSSDGWMKFFFLLVCPYFDTFKKQNNTALLALKFKYAVALLYLKVALTVRVYFHFCSIEYEHFEYIQTTRFGAVM